MRYTVFTSTGETRAILHKFDRTGTFMNERSITVDYEAHAPIGFRPGDWIEYQGQRYTIEQNPTIKKESTDKITYSLQFVSRKYELERCQMRDLVPSDNGIVYPTPLLIEFTGKVNYLTERIQACLDDMYGAGVWTITIEDRGKDEEKNISLQNTNCWSALSLVYSEYGLYFYVNERDITITSQRKGVIPTHLRYGYQGGLYTIERNADTSTGVVTKLRAYGGERNLDYSYPKQPEYADSVLEPTYNLYPLRVMLPSFKLDGKTDYIMASAESVNLYGVREASITYDDIYPSITGATNSEGQRIDQLASVEPVTDEKSATFKITTYPMGFKNSEGGVADFKEDLLTTTPAQLNIKTGTLQGYTFNISDAVTNEDGSYVLTLERGTLSDSGEEYYVPNKDWNASAGDEFVLLHIVMPQSYVLDAEQRLLARAQEYLEQYSKTNFSYSVTVSEKFLAENNLSGIQEGMVMIIDDPQLGWEGVEVLIQSVTVREGGDSYLPKYELTLNNEPSADVLERIQGQISNLESTTAAGFTSQQGIYAQYHKKLDKSVWDSVFIRHYDNKENPTELTSLESKVGLWTKSFISSLGRNPGQGGGGGEGGASALYQLNDVKSNTAGTGVEGAATGKVLTYGSDGFWYAADAVGLDETALGKYLTDNSYAKKSDIPSLTGYATQAWVQNQKYLTSASLTGYATQSWVNTKLGDYTTTADLTTLLGNKVDKVTGKGLSTNDFTDALLTKLNGIATGANKYVLPTASATILGGVKVGATLGISDGSLNLKSGIITVGTYTKVTVDTYGRVTGAATLVSSDIPTLAISKISGLQTALDGKANTDGSNATGTWDISITGSSRRLYQAPLASEDLNDLTYTNHSGKMYYAGGDNTTVNLPTSAYGLMVWRIASSYTGQIAFGSNDNLYKRRISSDGEVTLWKRIIDEGNYSSILDTRYVTKTFLARLFGAMDAEGNEIAVNNTSTVIDSIKAKVGLWTEQYLSSLGFNPNAGSGGGGSDYDRLDAWGDYDASKSGYVLSAGLGWDLNTRVESLESKSITLTTTGTGNGLASFTQTGNSVVFTKANFLTSHQTIYGLTLQKNGTSLGTYTPNSAAKTINITVPTKVSELSNDSGFALKSYVDGNFPKLTDGLIPSSYLPSYVDDVIEAANLASFPKTGESGKIYVALDTNLTYRWSGTTYVEISPSLALGETATTAYAGNKGKANATAIAALRAITISAGTGLSGGGNLTANRTISLKVATTEALGGIKVGNRLSIDDDGVLSATYTYTLPTASATVLGGVKVGTTLAIASGVLNLKATGTAGTYFKVTTDAYGRVTAGSNPTTLAGFGITDGVNAVTVSGSGNAVTSASISGHKITLTKGTTFLTKAAFDDLFEKVNIGTSAAPVYAIKAKYGLYTEQFLSSMGLAQGSGGGGGSDLDVYGYSDLGGTFDDKNLGNTFNAYTINDINSRVVNLEGGAAVTVTTSGTGTVVTGVTKAGTVITVTKSNLAFGSITGKPTTLAGYGITDAYTKTQADSKYVTLSTAQTISGLKTFSNYIRLGNNSIQRVNNATGNNATGSWWYTANYAAIQAGIGCFTNDNTSLRLFMGWGETPWNPESNLTISSAQLTYKGNSILHSANYNSYAPTKTGTGASGTWSISITGSSRSLYFYHAAAVANNLLPGAGLYYNQISSSTDTGYPSNYGHVIRLQRGGSTTLTSSQLVLDLFHQTDAAGLNQLYLRTGYGDGSKMVWGSFVQLLHTGNYTSLITKIGTSTVGGTAKGIYLNGGTPTAMSATVGSTTLPVYMNAGTITACSTTLGVSVTGYSKRLLETVLTNEDLNTYTYSSYSGRTFSGGGGNTVANKPSSLDSFGLLVLRSAGGYTTQLAYSGSDLYARYYNGTTWYAWTEFAHITDNIASATKLQTARTINGTSFNGTANITTANWGTARNIGIVNSDGTGTAVTTSVNGSANVNLKLPATIKAALTGNATTATTLQTSRTLWGQSFNGSANVSGTLTGVESVVARSGRINNFLSYMDNSGNPAKGTICITLPNGWTSSMNTYEIWVYEYSTATNASVITIGAYNYNGGGDTTKAGWVNIGYHTKGSYSKGVRLAYNGSKCVILLGTTTTTWSYPKVYLKTVYTGHSNQTVWGGTCTISLITSESGYTNIATPARMDEFFGDTSVTGALKVSGAGHFGYTYTTMTGGVNVIGNSATNGFCLYDGSGTTARIYRISDVLYITRGGDNAKGLRMDTAGNIYPGGNNTLTNGKSDARWANMFSVLLNVSGVATFASTVTATGTIASTAGYLKSTLNGNTVQIGSQNSSWAHFQSSVPFYFNTRINVNGHLYPHTNNAFTSGGTSNRWSNVFATAGNFSSYIDIGSIRISYDSANNALKVAKTDGTAAGLYAMGFLSSMGLATGTGGGGGGSDYDRLDSWSDYTADKAGYVLSAKLGNDLNTRVKSLEGGSALTVTTTGSGNAVTAVTKSGTVITVTKGTTFLTSHQSLANYVTLNSTQTITATKKWTASQWMGATSICRSNNTTAGNATGSFWYTDTTYATIQFGIGVYTDNNVSPRAFIGWGTNPWTVSSNLTVSSTQLTYKSNNILHAANYNDYAPTKTGTGASGTWGISISGNAATASTSTKLTTARTIWGQSFNGTANVSGALSSASTISASGVIATTSTDPGFRVLSGSANKTAVGYRSADAGAYIYSYVSAKYMGVHDGGYPVFGAGNGCLMMPYTVKLFTKSDYEYWVVLLWETTTQTTHRLTGKIYTNTTGGNRYQAADVALWYSKWSTAGDSSFLFNTYGQATPWNLVTCTYGGKTYYALQHINIQAVNAYFMGTYSNIAFTAVKYYTMAYGDVAAVVNNSEINGSIADVTTSVMSANGTPYALTSSNVASATKLATARTLWGQSFNGTANVSGSLTGVGNITASGAINIISTGANSISLKYNSADATSVILNGTQFKPSDAANGKLALGSTSARWNGVYSTTGNFSGAVTSSSTIQGTQLKSTVATGTAPLTVASTTKVTNLNADLLDGYHLNSAYAVNTVVMRNSNGYIYAGYINSNTAVNENANISQIITTTSSDGFFRKSSLDQLRSSILNIKKTLDLTALDANKWYPCTVTLSKNILYTIQIWNSLNGDKPAWATHANGFTLNLMWQVSGDEWGAGKVQRKILNSYYNFAPSNPCGGIEQNVMASVEIVYLRGGAKYYYLIDNGNAFAINSSGYSWKSGDYSYSAPVLTAVKADPVRCYSASLLGVSSLYAPYIGSAVNFNSRISITTDGKLTPYSTSTRRSGVYGVYDVAKIGHIWSMGTGYMIADDGSNFGNLYGFAYKHITNTTGGTMANGHQAVWCENGAPRVALGSNLWVANVATIGTVMSASTVTIRSTDVVGHLNFSRGSFNYITAPASGSIAFIAGGQAVGEATCELIINSGYLYAGTTNATALGKSDRRWSNTYTQLLNVAGAATLSSTLAVVSTITGSGAINGSRLGISNTSHTTGYGLSLYDGAVAGMPTYGIAFAGTGTFGTHGGVSGDWATYFTMSDTTTRGWIFRRGSTCVASISGAGTAAFSGGLTVAGTANLNGVLNANNVTDATSTTVAGAVFDGGVGIAKQLRVGGAVTLSSSLVAPYTSGQWISLATRTNIIYGGQSQSEASAHGLFRVKTFGGNAVTFGGLKNETGFYGFTKAIIDAGTNNYSWKTTWDTATGNISTTGAISTGGSLNATGAINANSTTDSTSTTTGSIICDGGLGVAKQLRVGSTSTFTGKTTHNGGLASTTGTFSSTLSVTGVFTASTTVNIAGVLNANNITDATSTTAASLVCDGGVGVVKQLRVGGAVTLSSTLSTAGIVSFTNATDATSATAAGVKITGGLGVAKQLRVTGATTLSGAVTIGNTLNITNATSPTESSTAASIKTSGGLYVAKVIRADVGIFSNGYMSSLGLAESSDMRFKNKLRDVCFSVKEIAEAPAFEYTWKGTRKEVMLGTSAQYWEGIRESSVWRDPEDRLSMFYGHTAMVGLISLARHFSTLSDSVETLEQKVVRLEKEVKELKIVIESNNCK